jgi:hypothetical protein
MRSGFIFKTEQLLKGNQAKASLDKGKGTFQVLKKELDLLCRNPALRMVLGFLSSGVS